MTTDALQNLSFPSALLQSPQNPTPCFPFQNPEGHGIKFFLEGLEQQDSDTCQKLEPVPCVNSPLGPLAEGGPVHRLSDAT